MKVLVAVASRYGSTREIAHRIADALANEGVTCEVAQVERVRDLSRYDAVILGSAVYAGRWMKAARGFAERCGPELKDKRVWLFSSGPIGDPPQPPAEDLDVSQIVDATGAVGHKVFSGKLVKSELRLADRAMAKAIKAPDGDFRDWTDIEAWSRQVAAGLGSPASV